MNLVGAGLQLRVQQRTARMWRTSCSRSPWGGYCATIAQAPRSRSGFSDEACAFFNFFARPAPELEQQAAGAQGPDRLDGPTLAAAHEYGLLLQAYEHLFWDTPGVIGARARSAPGPRGLRPASAASR
ncbi:hypothetical protein [Kitasatospora sp. NPDC054795]